VSLHADCGPVELAAAAVGADIGGAVSGQDMHWGCEMIDRRFMVDAYEPAYLSAAVRDSLPERVRAAVESLRDCRACPRDCGADRLAGETRVCHTGRYARVSSAFAHRGEEVCLSGTRGSGTIFFARCNLRCVFCQNWDISQADDGRELPPEAVADLMLTLQEEGCHNINLVTPEHVVPQMIEAIARAIDRGLALPIVYNTSGYDSLESLRQLEGLVDIYMPDVKLFSPERCRRYLGAEDYGEAARVAVTEMYRQVGDLKTSRNGIACRGLLVRHLVMPGLLDETAAVLDWLAREICRDTFLNLMAQYRPAYRVARAAGGGGSGQAEAGFPEINRRPTNEEIARAYALARRAGLWRFDERL